MKKIKLVVHYPDTEAGEKILEARYTLAHLQLLVSNLKKYIHDQESRDRLNAMVIEEERKLESLELELSETSNTRMQNIN